MKKFIFTVLFLLTLILLILPAGYLYAQPNLITNGDFETQDYASWTFEATSGSTGSTDVISENSGANYFAYIQTYNGDIGYYQDISITSPDLALSFDVRSSVDNLHNHFYYTLTYYSGGTSGTIIATRGWNETIEYTNWTTISDPNVMDTFPSTDFSNADTVRVRFRVIYNSSTQQYVKSDFDNFILTYNETPSQATEEVVEEPFWVRTMPMTCWQVWINEDNNFQFIFWYPYKDNNWVRIYDMEGNMVFEVDLPVHDPNLIVDLPDGFYLVKTFHCSDEPIQEFIIGKP